MWKHLVVIAILGACSDKSGGTATKPSSPDQCPAAVDKLFELLKRNGYEAEAGQRERAIGECRKKPDDPMAACVIAANDDAAIEACLKPAPKGEPSDQLAIATESLRTYFFVHETFTDENVPLTPPKACCQFPTKKCPAMTAPNEVLTGILKLDFSTERTFQYRFTSSGNKAVVEAVGDRDCDGKTVTYRRELEQRADGNMHITVVDPRADSD